VCWKTFRIFQWCRTQEKPPEDPLPGAFFMGVIRVRRDELAITAGSSRQDMRIITDVR